MKLPIDQRPPSTEIEKLLRSKINPNLLKLFIVDIQNDCDCNIEHYDGTSIDKCFYLNNNKIKEIKSPKICLTMQEDISNEDIENLILECLNMSTDDSQKPKGYLANFTLINQRDLNKIITHEIVNEVKTNYTTFLAFDFIPRGKIYSIPEPEFFGVVTANVGRFGAFCMSDDVFVKDIY